MSLYLNLRRVKLAFLALLSTLILCLILCYDSKSHNLILMAPGPSRSKYSCVEGCNSESFNVTGPLRQHQKVCQVYIASKKGNVAIRSRALADYTVARTERVNRRANLLVCISYPTYDHTYNALYDTPGHRQT